MTPIKVTLTPKNSLQARCIEMLYRLNSPDCKDPVAELVAFLVAEQGRATDPAFADALPLCVYFGSKEDRAEFVAAIRAVKPDMIMKELP